MLRLVTRLSTAIFLSLGTLACSPTRTERSQEPLPLISSAAAPSRKAELSTVQRLYVGLSSDTHQLLGVNYRNCNFNAGVYQGSRITETTTLTPPVVHLPDEVAAKFLQFRALDQDGHEIYLGTINNPFYPVADHDGYWVWNCDFDLFLDLPIEIRLQDLSAIELTMVAISAPKILIRGPFTGKDLAATSAPPYDAEPDYRIARLIGAGDPSQNFDLVFLGDGYNSQQAPIDSEGSLLASEFARDVLTLTNTLLTEEPYRSLRDRINVWIIGTPSVDAGISDALKGIHRDTVYGALMGSSCMPGLLTFKKGVRALEMAYKTPFDQAVMVVNTTDPEARASGGVILTLAGKKTGRTLVHELGHSLGLLADQYFYFSGDGLASPNKSDQNSDKKTADECVQQNKGQLISTSKRAGGKNSLYTDEARLAPNLSLTNDPDAVKWKAFLTPDSPVVNFQYPVGFPVVVGAPGEPPSLQYTFIIEEDQSPLRFVSGPDAAGSDAILGSATGISINGVDVSTITYAYPLADPDHPTDSFIHFLEMPHVSVNEGEVITVRLQYSATNWGNRVFLAQNAHGLAIPSRAFDPNQLGIFQGAFPHLKKVWRSSYVSVMGEIRHAPDALEEAVLRQAIERYLGP